MVQLICIKFSGARRPSGRLSRRALPCSLPRHSPCLRLPAAACLRKLCRVLARATPHALTARGFFYVQIIATCILSAVAAVRLSASLTGQAKSVKVFPPSLPLELPLSSPFPKFKEAIENEGERRGQPFYFR